MIPSRKAWVGSIPAPFEFPQRFCFIVMASRNFGNVKAARQNLPLNLPTNRRLCSTVGGRIVARWIVHCCAISAARARAATILGALEPGLGLERTKCAAAKGIAIRSPRRPGRLPSAEFQDLGFWLF